jgi:putative sigma-54 modulation protein
MKLEITARRLTVDAKTKDTIEKRLEKLSKVLPREAEAKVVIRLEKRGVLVEVTITARQRTWTADAVATDQLTAAQNALDRVAAQAKKTKARVKEEKKHTVSAVRNVAAAVAPEKPEKGVPPREKAPRVEAYEARRMFDEDALHAFGHSKREILAYRDPSDESLRILYRRKDGTVVILTPS